MEFEPKPLTDDDSKLCGRGEGAECCIWLTFGPEGFVCSQNSSLRSMILKRKPGMKAQRQPEGNYPNCQTEGRK